MIPPIYNLPTGYRGDSYGPFSFFFSYSGASGIQPVDLNGYRSAMQFRNKKTRDVVLEWDSNNGSILVSGSGIYIQVKPGEEMEINAGTYDYDLQLMSGNYVKTYVRGDVTIVQDTTDVT